MHKHCVSSSATNAGFPLILYIAQQQTYVVCCNCRPLWQQLRGSTTALITLIVESMRPPVVERQVATEDTAHPAVVTVEAEAYATAGGRMSENDWHALQGYR